jgi:hypothetical protein
MSETRFDVESVMQSAFLVGQLVRVRGTRRLCEVVRILPVVEDGMLLYVIRSEQGAELIVRQSELGRT